MRTVMVMLDTLSRLMDEERRALLDGEAVAFERIATRKDAALAKLTAALANAPDAMEDDAALQAALQTLRFRAGRSRDLLAAALDGLRDAQGMVTAARESRHDTYTAEGGKERHRAAPNRLEKRA